MLFHQLISTKRLVIIFGCLFVFLSLPVAAQQNSPANSVTANSTAAKPAAGPLNAVQKDGVYEVDGPVLPPKLIKAPSPEYSKAARIFHIEGDCKLSLIVDTAGKPQNVEIVKKVGLGLDENALRAVKKYRFEPATLNGKPVPVKIYVVVRFHICETKEDCKQKQAASAASHPNSQ